MYRQKWKRSVLIILTLNGTIFFANYSEAKSSQAEIAQTFVEYWRSSAVDMHLVPLICVARRGGNSGSRWGAVLIPEWRFSSAVLVFEFRPGPSSADRSHGKSKQIWTHTYNGVDSSAQVIWCVGKGLGHSLGQAVSRRGPGSIPGHVGFVVDKVRQVFSEYFGFPCQFSFHRLFHIQQSFYHLMVYSLDRNSVVKKPTWKKRKMERPEWDDWKMQRMLYESAVTEAKGIWYRAVVK
jgi:hypothetical protein